MFCVAGVYTLHDGADLKSLIEKMLHDCAEWCRHMNVGWAYFETEDWRGVSWNGENYPDLRICTVKCAERVNCVVKSLVNSCTGGNIMFLRKEGLPQGLGRLLALEGHSTSTLGCSLFIPIILALLGLNLSSTIAMAFLITSSDKTTVVLPPLPFPEALGNDPPPPAHQPNHLAPASHYVPALPPQEHFYKLSLEHSDHKLEQYAPHLSYRHFYKQFVCIHPFSEQQLECYFQPHLVQSQVKCPPHLLPRFDASASISDSIVVPPSVRAGSFEFDRILSPISSLLV
nr:uncharacterized protein LOC109147873 [Ipomoea batatas]